MYILENRTNGQKTGFWHPGHENGHKSCQEGTGPYCKGFMLVNTKTWFKLIKKSEKVNFRAQMSPKETFYDVQIF